MEPRTRSAWPRLLLAGLASAIVMLSFLVPLVRSFMSQGATPHEGARANSGRDAGPSLGFSIQRGDEIWRGTSGDVVFPGDRIRFTYTSPRDAHFALLRSSSQHAQLAYPRAAATVPLWAARDAGLDLEIELDKRGGTERVFGLFCAAPLELEPVRAALEKAEALPPLPGCRVALLTLQRKLQ